MTPGQTTILDCWLAQFTPSDTYDIDTVRLMTTDEIICELATMADWDTNDVADHIAAAGFRYQPHTATPPSGGWMLNEK